MFIQGNISLRVRKPFEAVVATSDEDPGLILKNCDSEVAFSEAPCFGFSLSQRGFGNYGANHSLESSRRGFIETYLNRSAAWMTYRNPRLPPGESSNPQAACSPSDSDHNPEAGNLTGWNQFLIKAELQVRGCTYERC